VVFTVLLVAVTIWLTSRLLTSCQITNEFFIVFKTLDPFADADKGPGEAVQDGLVHIRIQQRNGRKTLTTIQGLSAEYDLKKIVRHCKKVCQTRFLFNGLM
jgi:translation initiation factor SUI1